MTIAAIIVTFAIFAALAYASRATARAAEEREAKRRVAIDERAARAALYAADAPRVEVSPQRQPR